MSQDGDMVAWVRAGCNAAEVAAYLHIPEDEAERLLWEARSRSVSGFVEPAFWRAETTKPAEAGLEGQAGA